MYNASVQCAALCIMWLCTSLVCLLHCAELPMFARKSQTPKCCTPSLFLFARSRFTLLVSQSCVQIRINYSIITITNRTFFTCSTGSFIIRLWYWLVIRLPHIYIYYAVRPNGSLLFTQWSVLASSAEFPKIEQKCQQLHSRFVLCMDVCMRLGGM